jgi:AGCS family alanine or glycine:cation symporter
MFQVNQTAEAFRSTFGIAGSFNWLIGIIMAILVGIVIIGGIKRIGAATSRIVPAMCGLYVLASLFIILTHITKVPETIGLVFSMAFTQNALYGGMVGVFVWGIRRATFSNEAGLGSAAIAHAAAKTDEPVREGIVAMIGPFIDTIIVCMMTAMVVIVTGAWNDPSIPQSAGVTLTTKAFESSISWFPYILTISIGLFAYSTMISWCYYGERGWIYLLDHCGGLGLRTVIIFRIAFIGVIVFGAVNNLTDVLDFSDLLVLSMAFPNIVGSIVLAPRVLEKVKEYWNRYLSGEMKPVR